MEASPEGYRLTNSVPKTAYRDEHGAGRSPGAVRSTRGSLRRRRALGFGRAVPGRARRLVGSEAVATIMTSTCQRHRQVVANVRCPERLCRPRSSRLPGPRAAPSVWQRAGQVPSDLGSGVQGLLREVLIQLLMNRAWTALPSANVADTTTRAPLPKVKSADELVGLGGLKWQHRRPAAVLHDGGRAPGLEHVVGNDAAQAGHSFTR